MSIRFVRWIARISCTQLQPSSMCAAFIKQSRMKCISATELHRKSGIREQSFVTVTALSPSQCLVPPKL